MDFRDTEECLSRMSISEPGFHQYVSTDHHSMTSPEPNLCDSFGSRYGYNHPIVPPPCEYSNESDSISADELNYDKSPTSDTTEVLGDRLSPDDNDFSEADRSLRAAIMDQIEPYCRKVFVGSVPAGVSAEGLHEFFSQYGPLSVDFRAPKSNDKASYAFLIYDEAKSVNRLLDSCVTSMDGTHVKILPCVGIADAGKVVVIRAWRASDRVWRNSLVKGPYITRYSVFVGGVPRVCTAVALAQVFEREFGEVLGVMIEVEANTGFPKGVARVTFLSHSSYSHAINTRFVTLFTLKPAKEVEVKPYLEARSACEFCLRKQTGTFCAGSDCLQYICDGCWDLHCQTKFNVPHKIIRRYDAVSCATPQGVVLTQLGFNGVPQSHTPPTLSFPADFSLFNEDSVPLEHGSVRMSSSSMSGYDLDTSFISHGGERRIGDLVPKRSHPISFHNEHSRPSMLHLPNRRTPIGEVVPEGQLPDYSVRVFIAGLPYGITKSELTLFFTSFGQVDVEMPSADARHAFLNFTSVSAVRALISHCQMVNERLAMNIYSESSPASAMIQVRPWLKHNRVWMNGSLPINYDLNSTSARYSVFIGGVPRSTTAAELAQVVQSHFGDVALLMIDVDQFYEYPKGSARAVFLTRDVYVRAIQQHYLTVYNRDHPKQVEIKPFVDVEMSCEHCGAGQFRSFCPEIECLKYFCKDCWRACHVYLPHHHPLNIRVPEAQRGNKRRGEKSVFCGPSPPLKLVRPERNDISAVAFLQPEPNGNGTFFDQSLPVNSALNMINVPLFHPFDAPEFGPSSAANKDFGPIGSGRPK